MHERGRFHLDIPKSCPFTISKISLNSQSSYDTWLIREHDQYGEYPHIYAKICQTSSQHSRSCDQQGSRDDTWETVENHGQDDHAADKVIILSDTGCGTEVPNMTMTQSSSLASNNQTPSKARTRQSPGVWNLRTFLEYTINPDGRIPYLVLTTHCHYDHILGLAKLPSTAAESGLAPGDQQRHCPSTTVLTSSHDKSFVTPYSNLQKHSLCGSVGLDAPTYTITWAPDMSVVTWHQSTGLGCGIPTPITVLHTPGHTPDSLSWYDADLRLLCVGDTFYVKETDTTRESPWGPEPPMPTIFPSEGNVTDLRQTLKKLLDFVQARNKELSSQKQNVVRRHSHRCAGWDQCGFNHHDQGDVPEPLFRDETAKSRVEDDWLFVDLHRGPPRVRLAAAHTTVSVDAEAAIVSFGKFMERVLRDEIPKVRVEDCGHGEERWLWDYALQDDGQACKHGDESNGNASPNGDLRYLYRYSVMAPLRVIEEGRKNVLLDGYLTVNW
ncbi:beta-lactamase-like protein [Exophiala viscosa]|uniref:Beta-lactamase-like protein n=1 Tax=Exophiala viscosa TaxID=2486360 RepID=A0AAN6IA85_9EURO|nr:beta-lactamase-like protein [Exophiala viscosa]